MQQVVLLGAAHSIAFKMARGVEQSRSLKLFGVYDENAALRNEAAQRLGVPAIAEIDTALACTPAIALVGSVPAQRAGLAQRALESGAAAIVDNPLALTHDALDQLIAAVDKYDRPVVTYQPGRGNPMVLAAWDAYQAGRIGDLVRVFVNGPHKIRPAKRSHWHWTRTGNGGILIDIGGHSFDFCCWFAGAEPDTITAFHANHNWPQHPEFQDFSQATIRFTNGVLANVEQDWLAVDAMQSFGDARLWLQGTKGKIELYMGDQTLAKIWTHETAGEDLDLSPYPGVDAWTVKLIEDLAAGHDGNIRQHQVWHPTRAALLALDSAQQGGAPVAWRP